MWLLGGVVGGIALGITVSPGAGAAMLGFCALMALIEHRTSRALVDPASNFVELTAEGLLVKVPYRYGRLISYSDIRSASVVPKLSYWRRIQYSTGRIRDPHVRIECARLLRHYAWWYRTIRVAVDDPETFVAELQKRLPIRSNDAAPDASRAEPAT
jgi:hypothetical protein